MHNRHKVWGEAVIKCDTLLGSHYIIDINEVTVYIIQLVTDVSEGARVDSSDESKEECKITRHPRSPERLHCNLRVKCDMVVAPSGLLILIMDPRGKC